MSMRLFGQVPEGDIYEVVLENRRGLQARILSLGAALGSLLVPDARGVLRDVVLGLADPVDYLHSSAYFGATVGRMAGRIKGAGFEWEGKQYQLDANEGSSHLHGGAWGFSRRLWTPIVLGPQEALFRLTSPEGDMGYPGQVEAEVRYSLEGNALRLQYRAESSRSTPFSLTHHSYFNLKGHKGGSVASHQLQLKAEAFLPVDEGRLVTGEIRPLAGTVLDFRQMRPLSDCLYKPELAGTQGLDHFFVLAEGHGPQAVLSEEESGLLLEVYTDQPGINVYTGGLLKDVKGKEGALYQQHQGICLESQAFPDFLHHPGFPSAILRPGEVWKSETVYRFEGAAFAKGKRAHMIYI